MKYRKDMRQETGSAGKRPQKTGKTSRNLPRAAQSSPHSVRENEGEDARAELVRKSVRKRKKRYKKNYILYYIILGVLFVVTGVTLSLTVFFNVEQFEVTGQGALSASQVIADSGIKQGDNLFRISTDRAARSIVERNVNVDSVAIHRVLPSTLRIEVTMSETIAVVYSGEQYYSLSRGNRIIGISEAPETTEVPLVLGCDFSDELLGDYVEPTGTNRLETLLAVVDAIEANAAQEQIPYVDLSSPVTIRMYYGDRAELKFSGIDNLDFELGRVLELFERGEISSEEYSVVDATIASDNAHYYVLPLEESPLPSELQSPSSEEEGTPQTVIGYDMPPDQEPPDWETTSSAAEE